MIFIKAYICLYLIIGQSYFYFAFRVGCNFIEMNPLTLTRICDFFGTLSNASIAESVGSDFLLICLKTSDYSQLINIYLCYTNFILFFPSSLKI